MLNIQKRGGKGKSGITTRRMKTLLFKPYLLIRIHQFCSFLQKVWFIVLKPGKYLRDLLRPKGKSLFNILPLKNHQSISSIMPFPEDESEWKKLSNSFCYSSNGKIRKNSLDDFSPQLTASGKDCNEIRFE